MNPFRTPGLDYLRSICGRDRPQAAPVANLVGFDLVVVDEGRAVFELDPKPEHSNPMGTVHGGVVATLCDSAAGAAVHSTLPAGVGYTSLDVSVRFVRPVTVATGLVRCEGSVLSRGRRIAVAEARLFDRAGKLLAHATSTCLVTPMDEGASGTLGA